MNTFDLHISQGNSYTVSLNLTDSNANPLNLSGYNLTGQVKNLYSDSGSLINLNPTITNAISGMISINVLPNLTTGIPVTLGIYDIEMYNETQSTKVLRGNVFIYPSVSF